ncbi:rhodanese-like domain-containing protein [Rhizobium sp. BE258]|uniref:sulfurtransferase n=1 Tax=Rhizobium sp. BE258 TaxID=2817722 RepID=UPI000DD53B2D|nr:rhodanese-like domain-containing protein [Rhizobium sp. BE258]MDR7144987.1 thiosulfate/3-mercaptopyruvate sulfurtransferase [Rhizobium sp. BE258]
MSLDPILEPTALGAAGFIQLLDVRDQEAFEASHYPSAVRVPVERWEAAAKEEETSLDNVSYWADEITQLGIHNKSTVAIYDDGRMTEAARVWFILQYFGASAFLLNGGWPALTSSCFPAEVPAFVGNKPPFEARPGAGPVGLVDRHALRIGLSEDKRILDARTRAEFYGNDLRKNTRGGHLPGARLLSHSSFLVDGWIKPPAELRDLLTEAGFQFGDHVVTHCDGGGRAALAAAVAARAGYEDVRAYYLSFADWAKDDSCPVVTKD